MLRAGIGLALYALGGGIVLGYWIYYLRCLAMVLGYGQVRYVSFTPLLAPMLLWSGGALFGPPLTVGAWICLIDANTYVLVGSLLKMAWLGATQKQHTS